MCCFFTSILLLGPRVGMLVWTIIQPRYLNAAFDHFIWGFLGWLFLPWTTLMYLIIYPGGIEGFELLVLGTGVFFDMGTYFGTGVFFDMGTYFRSYANRSSVPYGNRIP